MSSGHEPRTPGRGLAAIALGLLAAGAGLVLAPTPASRLGLALAQAGLLAAGVVAVRAWLRHEREARLRTEQLARQRRQANEAAQDAIRAAEDASRSKSRFLANMSHELRTPFQGVLGMLQLMEQTPLNPLQQDMVRTSQESARHLLALLNDILDISALEAGRLRLHDAPLDLRRLCSDVRQLMRVRAAERGLRLHVKLSSSLPPWVLGDATRIKQILFNLLGNAVKFTPQGEVSLHAMRVPGPAGHAALRFEVVDTGIGMDDAVQARLFQRFELGDAGLSREVGGAGLGLEISRTLARMMGGDLTVRSRPGQGSTFVLTMVLLQCAPPEAADIAAPPASADAPPHPLRVLVADDHPVNRKFMALLLGSLGHQAGMAEDGLQAVEQVRRGDFDVVLMDIHMPVLDGLDATRAIRELPGECGTVPVFGLTADVLPATRQAALAAGFTEVLVKPVDAGALAAALTGVAPRPRHWAAEAAAATWQPTVPQALYGDGTQPAAPDRADAAPMTQPGLLTQPGGLPLSAPTLSPRFAMLEDRLPEGELPGLLEMFFADRSNTLADLRDALRTADPPRMAEAAHRLKGSARLMGFRRLAAVAERVERCVDEGRLDQAPALARSLEHAIEATRSAVGLESA